VDAAANLADDETAFQRDEHGVLRVSNIGREAGGVDRMVEHVRIDVFEQGSICRRDLVDSRRHAAPLCG
jgi:hypothetical protein